MFKRVLKSGARFAEEGAHLAEEGFEEGEKFIKVGAKGLYHAAQAGERILSRDVAPALMKAGKKMAVGLERGTKQMVKKGGIYARKGEMLVQRGMRHGATEMKRGLTFAEHEAQKGAKWVEQEGGRFEHEAQKGAKWVEQEGGRFEHAVSRAMSVPESSDDEEEQRDQQTSPTAFHPKAIIDDIFRRCHIRGVFTEQNFRDLLHEAGDPTEFNLDEDGSTFQSIHLKDSDYYILHIRNRSQQTIVLNQFHPTNIVAAIHISTRTLKLSRPEIFPANYEQDQTKREWIDDTTMNLSRLVFTPDERGDHLDEDDYLDIEPETQVALILIGDTKPTFRYSESSDPCIPPLHNTHREFPQYD